MAKMIIMKGLPASGKSTKAKELVAQGNTVRINKDLIRTMLHFDKFTGHNESMTRDAARTLAHFFLGDGKNVIIDDTNLNPSTVQSWVDLAKELNAKIQYADLTDVPLEDCVRRDAAREKKVGAHVIKKMALQHLDYLKGQDVVVCDLDGTLCDISHRLHLVKSEEPDFKPNWREFFARIPADSVRVEVLDQLLELEEAGNKIILVSARPEDYREATEVWLEQTFKGYPLATALIMREHGDHREDSIVKRELYDKYLKNLNIIKVFDDRPRVIRMWQELGLPVVDCGSGVEF
jgi:predicted kinase